MLQLPTLIVKTAPLSSSYLLFPATVLHGATFIDEQPEGFWLRWLLLLLFREHHGGKVWKRLSLELRNLEEVQRTVV